MRKNRYCVRQAKKMMKRARKRNSRAEVWADKAYDCEELHELSDEKGFTLLARTRKSSRKRPKGRFRRKVDNLMDQKPNCNEY